MPQLPYWWDWELTFGRHIVHHRMVRRDFNKTDVRVMLSDPRVLTPQLNGRWRVSVIHEGRPWTVVLEPVFETRVVEVVTAYLDEPLAYDPRS